MGNATLQKLTEYQRTEAVDIRGYTLQQAVEYEIRWRRDLSTTHPDQHGGPAKINIGHTTYRLLAEQFGALTPRFRRLRPDPRDQCERRRREPNRRRWEP